MPQDDAVTQDGPTCPMSEEDLAAAWNDASEQRIGWNHGHLSDWNATSFREFARLFARGISDRTVAAERARLRAELCLQIDAEAGREFDRACQTVDANQRRA